MFKHVIYKTLTINVFYFYSNISQSIQTLSFWVFLQSNSLIVNHLLSVYMKYLT